MPKKYLHPHVHPIVNYNSQDTEKKHLKCPSMDEWIKYMQRTLGRNSNIIGIWKTKTNSWSSPNKWSFSLSFSSKTTEIQRRSNIQSLSAHQHLSFTFWWYFPHLPPQRNSSCFSQPFWASDTSDSAYLTMVLPGFPSFLFSCTILLDFQSLLFICLYLEYLFFSGH